MSLRVQTRALGAAAVKRRLHRIAETLRRDVPSILKQEARSACVNIGFNTYPYGFSEEPAIKFRQTVAADIRKVYVDRNAISAITDLIKPRSPRLAMAFWHASKNGNLSRANKYLREAGIKVEVVDRSLHRSARTGPRGSVAKTIPARQLVRTASLNKYTREKQATVGTAKAGWYAAAKSLGGRVRTNTRDASGRRGTSETFPAYVRKVARKYHGLGGSLVSDYQVTIWSNVAHGEEALVTDFNTLVDEAQQSFRAALDRAIQAAIRGNFKRRQAA